MLIQAHFFSMYRKIIFQDVGLIVASIPLKQWKCKCYKQCTFNDNCGVKNVNVIKLGSKNLNVLLYIQGLVSPGVRIRQSRVHTARVIPVSPLFIKKKQTNIKSSHFYNFLLPGHNEVYVFFYIACWSDFIGE